MPSRKKMGPALGLAALLWAAAAHGEILFQESFEVGHQPFAFQAFQPSGSPAAGALVEAEPPRGRVWLSALPPDRAPGLFGHRLRLDATAGLDRLHWAAYVRFGTGPDGAEWLAAGATDYQLELPVVSTPGGQPLLVGRFRAASDDGRLGRFELVTANGRVHRPVERTLLVPGRWYAIEFGVHDRGRYDRVSIWIDNDDPDRPDYDLVAADLVDADAWAGGLQLDHGVMRHAPAVERHLSYDSITVADGFIGLPVVRSAGPAAPQNLQVE